MKLTEAKLKQMILETMQRSANYEKLRILMGTTEGYCQAESLYEMVRETFDEEEQMHMDIFSWIGCSTIYNNLLGRPSIRCRGHK